MSKFLFLFVLLLSTHVSARGYVGEWVVDKIIASHISNLTLEEAQRFLGIKINYQSEYATSGGNECKSVTYREELFNERSLHSYHKIFFDDLGSENIENVLNVELLCGQRPWFEFGAIVIEANSKVFISYSGYIFELRRINT